MTPDSPAEWSALERMLACTPREVLAEFVLARAQQSPERRRELQDWLFSLYVPSAASTEEQLKDMVETLFRTTPLREVCTGRRREKWVTDWCEWNDRAELLIRSGEGLLKAGKAALVPVLVTEFFRQLESYARGKDLDEEWDEDVPSALHQAEELLKRAIDAPELTQEEREDLRQQLERMSFHDFYTSYCYIDFEALMERIRTASLPLDETLKQLEERIAQTPSAREKEALIARERALLLAHGRGAEIPALLGAHADSCSCRRERAELLLSQGRYEEAMAIIEASITSCGESNAPIEYAGRAEDWLLLRQQCAAQQGDVPQQREACRALFVQQRGSRELYGELKKLVSAAEWPSYAKAMLEQVEGLSYFNENELAEIYLAEGQEEHLPQLLDKLRFRRLAFICRYVPRLHGPHAAAFLSAFRGEIVEFADHRVTRQGYQELVRMLRRVCLAPGGEALAEELAAEFRERYPRRRALLQELDAL